MLVMASQLALYDQIKETILKKGVLKDGLGTHVTMSFAAGFVAAVASNSVDVIKTRVMNMKVELRSPPPYTRALDCALKTVRFGFGFWVFGCGKLWNFGSILCI